MTDKVTLTIDGIEVSVPKGTLVIRAAEQLGIDIPRFCDHPLLEPAGACRQCLVDVEGQRKPVASCTQTCADGMVVKTQHTSQVAEKAQAGIMEFLLLNHPLDCPVCDKGGECPLQNQAMTAGAPEARFHEVKREFRKPLPISSQVLLDRERCILCQRCTRFSEEIAGDPFIDLMERGASEQIGVAEGEPFNSYFSGNTVQICPVGALTGAQYRFRARPFDLVSTPSACEHCAAGCDLRTDSRRGKVMRRLAGDDTQVNEEWSCDKGRWGFQYVNAFDRLTDPLIRDKETGQFRKASWSEALRYAAEGLRGKKAGVLTGGRLTVEDAYAYAKFARVALGTNDIDFRARPHSTEEAEFLAAAVAAEGSASYLDIEAAPAVVLAGLEPEEECPILFLRLRKSSVKNGVKVFSVQPFATGSVTKTNGTLIPAAPGTEAEVLDALIGDVPIDGATPAVEAARLALNEPGAILLVGERLATVPGALSAAVALAEATGAKLAWVPRRAGDRGAIDAGCLPNLLPGGRVVDDLSARAQLAERWGVDSLPSTPGRDTAGILAAAASGDVEALVVAGVDPHDLADVRAAEAALDGVGFLISLELRMSAVARRADVVFPVAATVEKAGSFLNWEGRVRTFDQVLSPGTMPDARVLSAIAAELGVTLGGEVAALRKELGQLPAVTTRPSAPRVRPEEPLSPGRGQAVLASWRMLIDLGSMTDGDDHLGGTARTPVVRLSQATADAIGATESVTVGTGTGAITLPLQVTHMPDHVVWVPTNSPGSTVHRTLGTVAGDVVNISAGGVQ
ncbi:NADH-quinone oxidoreductase [Longispora fulva]|uniref:NADH-quinone oxidoreductase n=1 Tax=Longispora fulva TaxID=619741 RepID=A0A8J7KN91_9ACTN|nr:NADH-quinone oxidoreductase subunit G [Longispora fulva]MBG6140016.1 NADH-quinone oxidoreductase subunit G [Longispora fulva]GIG57605.1 NADH-quinone oxidoreductase [Longispora fulva]